MGGGGLCQCFELLEGNHFQNSLGLWKLEVSSRRGTPSFYLFIASDFCHTGFNIFKAAQNTWIWVSCFICAYFKVQIWETQQLRLLVNSPGQHHIQEDQTIFNRLKEFLLRSNYYLGFKTKHDTDMWNMCNTSIFMCLLIDQNPLIVSILDSYWRSVVSVVQKATSHTPQGRVASWIFKEGETENYLFRFPFSLKACESATTRKCEPNRQGWCAHLLSCAEEPHVQMCV